jgi:P pilus assembly chaperone PapD
MQNEVVMTGCSALFYRPHEGENNNPEKWRQHSFDVSRDEQSTEQTGAYMQYASLNDGDTF